MASLLSLPDLVLVRILSYFCIGELLQTVNRTCKKLHEVIENNSYLWRNIDFDYFVSLNAPELERLLRHSSCLQTCLLPFALDTCGAHELDILFTANLCNLKQLYWLDISHSQISTLCFLRRAPSLTILNVSECPNLVDADFTVVATCNKLDQLYLSFNNIQSETVLEVCSQLTLTVLDLSGIRLTVRDCDSLITSNLIQLYVSFVEGVNETEIVELRQSHMDCNINKVF